MQYLEVEWRVRASALSHEVERCVCQMHCQLGYPDAHESVERTSMTIKQFEVTYPFAAEEWPGHRAVESQVSCYGLPRVSKQSQGSLP